MSSGSSGNRVMVPEPSRSTFCLINLIVLEGSTRGEKLEVEGSGVSPVRGQQMLGCRSFTSVSRCGDNR